MVWSPRARDCLAYPGIIARSLERRASLELSCGMKLSQFLLRQVCPLLCGNWERVGSASPACPAPECISPVVVAGNLNLHKSLESNSVVYFIRSHNRTEHELALVRSCVVRLLLHYMWRPITPKTALITYSSGS